MNKGNDSFKTLQDRFDDLTEYGKVEFISLHDHEFTYPVVSSRGVHGINAISFHPIYNFLKVLDDDFYNPFDDDRIFYQIYERLDDPSEIDELCEEDYPIEEFMESEYSYFGSDIL